MTIGLRRFKALDEKRHNPAVGRLYGKTLLGKTLIVGLSHYGNEEELRQPQFTHDLIESVIGGQLKIRYFAKLAKLFRNDNGDIFCVKDFYQAVAFYNFLPDHFARPRQATTQAQCKHAETQRFLFKAIDRLRPNHLIVTSENLWRLLPAFHPDDDKTSRVSDDPSNLHIPFNSAETECFWYRRKDGGYCLVGAITHPSAAKFNKVRGRIAKWAAQFITMRHV